MIFNTSIYGKSLPDLSNPGTSSDLLQGKQLIDKDGNVLTGTIPSVSGTTIRPGASQKTVVESGRYTTGPVYVEGSSSLLAENIKSGVSIFGVTGNYSGEENIPISTVTIRNNTSYLGTVYYYEISSTDPYSYREKYVSLNGNNSSNVDSVFGLVTIVLIGNDSASKVHVYSAYSAEKNRNAVPVIGSNYFSTSKDFFTCYWYPYNYSITLELK